MRKKLENIELKTGLIKKLHNSQGFSLTELLVAVLILSLVSATVAGGVPVARDAYNKVVVAANAEVMLSTAISAIRNEIGTADNVKVSSDNKVYYHKLSTGSMNEMSSDGSDGISLRENIKWDPAKEEEDTESAGSESGSSRRLVSQKAGTDELIITYDTVSKSGNIVSFSKIQVKRIKGGSPENMPRASLDTLKIRVIAE